MQVRLAAPSLWRSLVAELDSKAENRAAAQAILAALHARHVGITPQLAAELAHGLHSALPPESTWGAVFKRLANTLVEGGKQRNARRSALSTSYRIGLLLRSSPAYVVFRLALPVTALACRNLGETILFCGDEVGADVTPAAYQEYAVQLAQQIIAIAQEPEAEGAYEVFWHERALVLATLSRTPKVALQEERTLPELDPPALGLLLRMEPKLRPGRQIPRLLRRPSPVKQFTSRREREGGFDGIRISRRLEEIDDILFSELINDPVTRADRLINTGYFVFERQPKQVKLRDVLVVGWLPEPTGNGPQAGTFWIDFVKACWFETIARFGLTLLHNDLRLSEFRWIEADSLARSRSASFLLTDLPIESHALRGDFTPEFRYTFLNALRWLPGYLDDRDYERVIPRADRAAGAVEPEAHRGLGRLPNSNNEWEQGLLRWADDVWRSQPDASGWRNRAPDGEKRRVGAIPTARQRRAARLAVEQFAVVHHVFMLPTKRRADLLEKEATRDVLNRLYGRLMPGRPSAGGVSVLWTPQDLDRETWSFEARGRGQPENYPPPDEGHSAERLSGWVVDTWLDHLIDEVRRG